MPDVFSKEVRSRVMSRIRSRDTKPEMLVRKLAHALGFRFRLHRRDLLGCPDLVFPRRRKIIFVHGCFWHMHEGCRKCRMPKSNRSYWRYKLLLNRDRDRRNKEALESLGWRVMVVWECEVKDIGKLKKRLTAFLGRD